MIVRISGYGCRNERKTTFERHFCGKLVAIPQELIVVVHDVLVVTGVNEF